MTPPQAAKPPRTKYLVKPTITGSNELPSPSPEPAYQDPDTSKPVLMRRSQSEAEVKPTPLPRTKSHPHTLCNAASTVQPTENSSNRSKHKGCPTDYKTPRPVRPPPSPPKTKCVTSSRPTTAANGNYYYLSLDTEPAVKSVAVSGERIPSPALPPRPERPSAYYDRTLPVAGVKPQGSTEGSPASRSPSRRSIQQPPVSSPVNESYDGMSPGVTASAPPPRPPRPGPSPTRTLPRSPSGFETSPPQGNQYFAVYEDRRAPPVSQRSQSSQRSSISSSSSSSSTQSHYDTPDEGLSSKPFTAPARPQHPPPPSFTPPPPPEKIPKRPPLSYPKPVYHTDPPYMEIEDPVYLEVLPQNNDRTFRPIHSVYRSGCRHETPGRPPLPHQSTTDDAEDINTLLRWLKTVRYSDNMAPSLYGLRIEDETREFNHRAVLVEKALRLFNLLLIKRNDALRSHISELTAISDGLDKLQKKTKTMGIAGGTTGAVGGVAAVVGIALAPVTMGASLIATAVGAGMVASAGGMGAHAAIANKKTVDRKSVEKIVQDYKVSVVDVERCLAFIQSGMDELRRHDLTRLQRAGARPEALRMAKLSQSVFREDTYNPLGKSGAPAGGMSSERLLLAFAKEMDLYFSEKDGQRLKKSTEYKFSSRVRLLAEGLQDELDQLNHKWEMFS
ncbi:WAS/WASL-interacting protein family member 1-like isoform X2 [Centroberyx affinis]|uniref:WAS/WASL-interacting protein family member 1-like isoform X2 n=1 Tax=Centroberyx affinis TaxID=166261 RepID=UPI003A5BAAFF